MTIYNSLHVDQIYGHFHNPSLRTYFYTDASKAVEYFTLSLDLCHTEAYLLIDLWKLLILREIDRLCVTTTNFSFMKMRKYFQITTNEVLYVDRDCLVAAQKICADFPKCSFLASNQFPEAALIEYHEPIDS